MQIVKDGLESSDAMWKVVVGHHPIFSTGEHGNTFELHTYILPILKVRARPCAEYSTAVLD